MSIKVTMKDIAREAGVSIATVSHVINGTKHISENKRKLITNVIEKYNYVPDTRAKSLRNAVTKTAGLVVSVFPDSYVTGIVNGIGKRARELDYHLLFINTNEDYDYEKESIKLLSSNIVDGIILTPSEMNLGYIQKYMKKGLPIIQAIRYDPNIPRLPRVTADDFQAGYDATKHLLQHGHRKIGVIISRTNITPTIERIEGYKAALTEYNIPFDEGLIESGFATEKNALIATKKLLNREKEITALFVLSDLMTIGAMQAITELSLKCPDDIALIGFGDFAGAAITNPPITNVSLSAETIGRTAFDVLLNKINNPGYDKHIQIPTSLMIRKSCGC
ncbi:LacI family DNA-binding transcriptional regulator [Neobacillus mesonae]|uniref:LacI family DNA-binding transcriptional regulator n=1 Tax=Neobacillus mesonae TaxID=1193713 RepID=UPI00203EABA6|nr:LacI family DNA-binding transcriptional regulator [Neobacillus mesonae]MCM3571010.1 LacI family transcriptional regulator [Neobacillus mesonae]